MGAGCGGDTLLEQQPAGFHGAECGCSAPSSQHFEAMSHLDDLLAVRHVADFKDKDPVHALAFASDGKLCTGSRDGVIKVWDPDFNNAPFCLGILHGHASQVNTLAFQPFCMPPASSVSKRQRLDVAATPAVPAAARAAGSAYSEAGGAVSSTSSGQEGRNISLPLLCSGSSDQTVRIWDITAPKGGVCVATLGGHRGSVEVLVFAPDGSLCSGSSDNSIRVWDHDLSSARCLFVLEGHLGTVSALCVSDNGQVCSGSRDGTVKVWNRQLKKAECMATLGGNCGWVEALAVAHSGELCAGSRDFCIRVWTQDRKGDWYCTRTLNLHEDAILTLEFAPDGSLVSGSRDQTIRVWDWDMSMDGKCLHTIGGSTDGVLTLAFAGDGTLCSSSGSGMVRVWECRRWRSHAKRRNDVEAQWRSMTANPGFAPPSVAKLPLPVTATAAALEAAAAAAPHVDSVQQRTGSRVNDWDTSGAEQRSAVNKSNNAPFQARPGSIIVAPKVGAGMSNAPPMRPLSLLAE